MKSGQSIASVVEIPGDINKLTANILKQLEDIDRNPQALLISIRCLRKSMIEHFGTKVDIGFIGEVLEQVFQDAQPSIENIRRLRQINFALSEKRQEVTAGKTTQSLELVLSDYGSTGSMIETITQVLTSDEQAKEWEFSDSPVYEADVDIANQFYNYVVKSDQAKMATIDREQERLENELNDLLIKLEKYQSLHGRINKKKKKLMEESIIELSQALWVDNSNPGALTNLIQRNSKFIYNLMGGYDCFLKHSRQGAVAPFLMSERFILEIIRYDALHLIHEKQGFFQKNKILLENADAVVQNAVTLSTINNQLENIKEKYHPRQGMYKIAHSSQSFFLDKKMTTKETKTYKKAQDIQDRIKAMTENRKKMPGRS